ncbi:MAG: N-acetylmuramoyl-L-alanine amidase-like domain-containing protein [Bacteroidota bacterium]
MPTSAATLALVLVLVLGACSPSDVRSSSAEARLDQPVGESAPPLVRPVVAASVAPADTLVAEPDAETARLFASIHTQAEAEEWAALPYGEIVQRVGEALVGQPYVAGLLDEPAEETLVVTLRGFDCVLYVENVLALAEGIAMGETSYEGYVRRVERMRYREGTMGSYCSRLHYFSDWIRDNESRGMLRNVTEAAGGERLDKQITFMSEHRDAYPKLATDDETHACIVNMEAGLADVDLFYIPQDRIAEAYAAMQPGDIIATATDIGGLDVTHTGFVHQTDSRTGFMHASSASEQVKVSPDLEDYVQGVRSQIGVVVARPLDPREAPPGG